MGDYHHLAGVGLRRLAVRAAQLSLRCQRHHPRFIVFLAGDRHFTARPAFDWLVDDRLLHVRHDGINHLPARPASVF